MGRKDKRGKCRHGRRKVPPPTIPIIPRREQERNARTLGILCAVEGDAPASGSWCAPRERTKACAPSKAIRPRRNPGARNARRWSAPLNDRSNDLQAPCCADSATAGGGTLPGGACSPPLGGLCPCPSPFVAVPARPRRRERAGVQAPCVGRRPPAPPGASRLRFAGRRSSGARGLLLFRAVAVAPFARRLRVSAPGRLPAPYRFAVGFPCLPTKDIPAQALKGRQCAPTLRQKNQSTVFSSA